MAKAVITSYAFGTRVYPTGSTAKKCLSFMGESFVHSYVWVDENNYKYLSQICRQRFIEAGRIPFLAVFVTESHVSEKGYILPADLITCFKNV